VSQNIRTHAHTRARKCHFENTDRPCLASILTAASPVPRQCSSAASQLGTELHAGAKFIPHGRFVGCEMSSGYHKVRSIMFLANAGTELQGWLHIVMTQKTIRIFRAVEISNVLHVNKIHVSSRSYTCCLLTLKRRN
jgi:hypothetical protein